MKKNFLYIVFSFLIIFFVVYLDCFEIVDIVFFVDVFESMIKKDFEIQKEVIKRIVVIFDVGLIKLYFGLIIFSSYV